MSAPPPDLPDDDAATTSRTPSPSRFPLALPVVLASVVALVAVLYLLGHLLAGDRLPADATISGVDVGGLSRVAAEERLVAELGPGPTHPTRSP